MAFDVWGLSRRHISVQRDAPVFYNAIDDKSYYVTSNDVYMAPTLTPPHISCIAKLEPTGSAENELGGRVRTQKTKDGFLLDRGFQIFLTSYPEAKSQLDYEALDLKPFYAGADVHFNGAFHRVAGA
eukprot:206882-Prorocentrum_minimum.AAC.6